MFLFWVFGVGYFKTKNVYSIVSNTKQKTSFICTVKWFRYC